MEFKEFNLNIVNTDDLASVTAFQPKLINQLKKLVEEYPDEVRMVANNKNGTCVFYLPKSFCHVSFSKRTRKEMTDEQKAAAAERMKKYHESKKVEDV